MEAEAGGGSWFVEDQSGEVKEIVFPVCGIVGVMIKIPDVGDLLLTQVTLGSLADTQQIIATAAGEPDQVERVFCQFTGRNELFRAASVGGCRECGEPGEFVGAGEGEVQ